MAQKITVFAIVALLVICAGEGLAISQLYSQNSNLNSQVNALNAQLSNAKGEMYPMVLVDDINRTVTIPKEPERIVSLEPSNTQIVYVLGDGNRLVGVTQYDTWPAQLNSSIKSGNLSDVGGIIDGSINVESIIALKPDLVLAWGAPTEQASTIQQLASAGIPVLVLAPQNITMMENDVLMVGKALDSYQNATIAVSNMQRVINFIQAKESSIPASQRPSVFYEVWNDPLITTATTSFLGELFQLCGGENLIENVSDPYPTVSYETVVNLNPQIIIAPASLNETAQQLISTQPGFDQTSAAKNSRVYILEDYSDIQEPSPRVVVGLLEVAQIIYPNLFSNVTLNIFNDNTGVFNSTALQSFNTS